MRDTYHYSQGVRVGDFVFVTGQGGWDEQFELAEDVDAQIRQAFRNVETVLAEADLTWADVIDITSYHVELSEAVLETMVHELRHCSQPPAAVDRDRRRRPSALPR